MAVIGAVLLLGLYFATLVFAMMDSPFAYTMFQICLYCTIAVPVLLYAMILVYRRLKDKNKELFGSTIDTVILDLGNVLVDYNWKKYLDTFDYDEEMKTILAEAMFLNPLWEEGDRGILSPEELTEGFVKNCPEYEQELRMLYETPGKTIFSFEYAGSWIQSLKKRGLKVYVLSNYSERIFEQSQEQLGFLSLVDGVLFSFQCHKIKPEAGIYEELIQKYGINPRKAIFIDDRQKNVEGAEKTGLQALRFTTYEDTQRALDRLLDSSLSSK